MRRTLKFGEQVINLKVVRTQYQSGNHDGNSLEPRHNSTMRMAADPETGQALPFLFSVGQETGNVWIESPHTGDRYQIHADDLIQAIRKHPDHQ